VDKNDSLYFQTGEGMKQPDKINFSDLSTMIDEKNRNIPGFVMVLKMDQAASYSMMVSPDLLWFSRWIRRLRIP
jgi:hypothetical protein